MHPCIKLGLEGDSKIRMDIDCNPNGKEIQRKREHRRGGIKEESVCVCVQVREKKECSKKREKKYFQETLGL